MKFIIMLCVFCSFICEAAITKCGNPATTLIKGKCVQRCQNDNEFFDGSTCACVADFERVGANCLQNCASDQTRNPSTGECELNCLDPNTHLDRDTKNCICNDGFELYETNCVVACQANDARDPAGQCQKLSHSKANLIEYPIGSNLNPWIVSAITLAATSGVFLAHYLINRNSRHEFSEVDDYLNSLPDTNPVSGGLGDYAGRDPAAIGRIYQEAAKKVGIKVLHGINPGDAQALGRAFVRISDPQKISAFWGAFNSLITGQQGSPKK